MTKPFSYTDMVYYERNNCVAALAQVARSLGYKVFVTKTNIIGFEDEWQNCIYIELPTGQVSWHFHDRESFLFSSFPKAESVEYDGHSTEDKYARLKEWVMTL